MDLRFPVSTLKTSRQGKRPETCTRIVDDHGAVGRVFLRIFWVHRNEKQVQYIDKKIFDVQEARRTGWRAAQVTAVTNGKWVSGCIQELKFGSFDRSRQWNTSCAACGRVGRRRTMSCRISEHVQEQEKRRYVCVVWLRVDRSHQRQRRGFTTDPLVWPNGALL